MTDYRIQCEKRISNLEVYVNTNDRRILDLKSDVKDLDKLFDVIMEITKNTSVMTSEMLQMKEDLQGIKSDLNTIKDKPIKEAIHYKRLVIGAIMLAIVSFVMGNLL